MTPKKAKRLKMDEHNRNRREMRRVRALHTYDERTMFKEIPSLQELRDALRGIRLGTTAIIRLAAIMDNLAMNEARQVYCDDDRDYRGKTDGIKAYLRQDGYLYSRYSSLMRYRKLGKLLREMSGVDIETNLLWGLEPQCPTIDDHPVFEDEFDKLRSLYESLAGMNFKQISQTLTRRINT